VPPGAAADGRLAKRDFHIELDAGTVTCPAGETAAIRTEPSGQRRVHFSKHVCGDCLLRERCTTKRGDRQVLIAPDEVSRPGFDGDLETRISFLERGTPSDATTQEVSRRAA
jgi:hypothetical protein